jgi:hypothetical protein
MLPISEHTAPPTTMEPPASEQPASSPRKRRRPLRIIGAVLGGLVLLLIGIVIGSAGKTTPAAIVHTRTVTKTVTVKVLTGPMSPGLRPASGRCSQPRSSTPTRQGQRTPRSPEWTCSTTPTPPSPECHKTIRIAAIPSSPPTAQEHERPSMTDFQLPRTRTLISVSCFVSSFRPVPGPSSVPA